MIEIDYSRDKLLDKFSLATLKDRYMLPSETSPQDAFARAARAFCGGDHDLAQRIYDYSSNLWFMYATPVLSNAPDKDGVSRGLPISCFLSAVGDSRTGLNEHWSENTWLASMGGGIGSYWGDVRSDGTATSKGSESTGSIPFMKVVDSQMLAISQGISRRGAYAAYNNISHPEIEEFIDMRRPDGGDVNRRCLNLHHGINITDAFMILLEECINNPDKSDDWDLIDPHSKEVVKTVSAKRLWQKILTNRKETGEPYIHYIDTTNRKRPEWLKEQGIEIRQSNLCSEITLPTSEERTAICCLSSVNLEHYDKWKDTSMVRDLIRFLDNVLQYFIENAPETMHKAIYSAIQERSLGLGAMGFHTYLQNKMIPFESAEATMHNRWIFTHLRSEAELETTLLGKELGSCADYINGQTMREFKPRRNSHVLAIAPNASSSIICGNVSPGIEPFVTNAYSQKTLNGTNLYKNQSLNVIIINLSRDGAGSRDIKAENALWKKVINNKGSIQGMSEFTNEEQEVFKCAGEINQQWVIEHASHRQEFIDQSQSVNIFVPAEVSKKEFHDIHFSAWKKGLKTLYYCRTEALGRAEDVSKSVTKHVYTPTDTGDCLSCEG